VNHDEKMDSIQLEYTYLLTSQLESQRRYFEEKISRVEENTQREIDDMVAQTRYLLITCFHESTKFFHKIIFFYFSTGYNFLIRD
jgi:hypothetical protein